MNHPEGISESALQHLRDREGDEEASYLDSLGYLTGGVGHLMTEEEQGLYPEGTTIPEDVRSGWLQNDSSWAYEAANTQMGELGIDDPALRDALIGVNFQMGPSWYKDTEDAEGNIDKGFKGVWRDMKAGNWESAAGNVQWVDPSTQAQASQWHEDTPVRTGDFMGALRGYGQSLQNPQQTEVQLPRKDQFGYGTTVEEPTEGGFAEDRGFFGF